MEALLAFQKSVRLDAGALTRSLACVFSMISTLELFPKKTVS
jgi:hypothetical protein